MSKTKFKGEEVNTKGSFPKIGDVLPDLKLIKSDLSTLTNADLKGKKVVFNIFPSVDTSVCAVQLKQFAHKLKDNKDVIPLFTSLDLPFALNRFCAAEGIENAITTSDFRFKSMASHGCEILDGGLKGLYARAVVVTDENLNIVYSQLVDDIINEPNYEEALKHI